MNNKARVWQYLEEHQDMEAKDLYDVFPDIGDGSIRAYLSDYRKKNSIAASVDTSFKPMLPAPPPAASNPDLDWLKANRKELERVLSKYKHSESIVAKDSLPEVKISGSVKVRSYSLSDREHGAFSMACEKLGVSKRQGIHIALRMFSDALR